MPFAVVFGIILVFLRRNMVVWMEVVVHWAVVLVFVWLVVVMMVLVRFMRSFENCLVGESIFL